MRVALSFRPDVMLISDTPHPFLFAPLKSAGIRLVCALHCTFWPAGFPPTRSVPVGMGMANGWFFRKVCDATLVISPECERQVIRLAGKTKGPVRAYRPKYRARIGQPRPTAAGRPFRVLFAGRCEREKGVFDTLELAQRLAQKRPGDFHFTICGGGSCQPQVEAQIAAAGLTGHVVVRGQLERRELLAEYELCDAVLVPTTPQFVEGLNKVALEALLAGRPAVLSTTIPAGELVGDAALVVPAGDLDGFQRALERLADNPALYRRCSEATIPAGDALIGSCIAFEDVVEQTLRAQLNAVTAAQVPPTPPVPFPG
jgi:glycosyltransferase involved in cell wall biosynthesis